MRRSAGGCYDIDGTAVHRVVGGPLEGVPLVRWRECQADLWAESATIAHLHHHLTAEESGLWCAMWKELQAIDVQVARLVCDLPAAHTS